MSDLPMALAFSAGVLAAVNPCGFALLPAYLSLLIVGDDSPGRLRAVGRAVVATVSLTLGFAAVFLIFGLAVAPVASQVQGQLPWFTVGFGLFLVVAGGWLVAGRSLPSLPRLRRGVRLTRSVPSMTLFGASYAIASLGCTIAPFLAVVVSTFRAGSAGSGIAVFAAYAAGMGTIVGIAALAVALARTAVVRAVRRTGAVAGRLGGALLIVAGGYVAYYGWYEIRVNRGGATADPVVDAAGVVQRRLADTVGGAGLVTLLAVLAALLAVGVLVRLAASRRRSAGTDS